MIARPPQRRPQVGQRADRVAPRSGRGGTAWRSSPTRRSASAIGIARGEEDDDARATARWRRNASVRRHDRDRATSATGRVARPRRRGRPRARPSTQRAAPRAGGRTCAAASARRRAHAGISRGSRARTQWPPSRRGAPRQLAAVQRHALAQPERRARRRARRPSSSTSSSTPSRRSGRGPSARPAPWSRSAPCSASCTTR